MPKASAAISNASRATPASSSTSSSAPTSTRSRACRRPWRSTSGLEHPILGARSGTVTEIYDYLRLLFARAGIPHCPSCGSPINRQTPEQIVTQLLKLKEGQKVQILAPLVRARKGQHLEVFQAIRRAGLIRARVDGEMVEVTDKPPSLAKTRAHTIEAVVDRISIREGIRPRLAESLDLALKLSGGSVLTLTESPRGWDEQLLSTHLSCPVCETSLPEIEPRSFSFNSTHGACPACEGLGYQSLPDGRDRAGSGPSSLSRVRGVSTTAGGAIGSG